MAGLSNFISNTATQSTTMPTWYDQAQQNVVNQATTGASNVPALANTVAGGAINELNNPATNPFSQAQGSLNQIASGAANPWITDASGNVTPNTATAMGGLFQAQNQQLNQLLPSFTAPVEGANIASGNFGSLRGQTAVDKAKADAFAQLLSSQMQAALQNQQTGATAASGLGQVGSQGITSMTNLGQAQQADPLLAASALGKIVGGINAPTTVTNATQLSPLNQIGSIASALGGSISGTNKLLQDLGIKGGLASFLPKIGVGVGGKSATGSNISDLTTNPDGTQTGTLYDANGNPNGSITMNPDGTQTIYDANGNATNYDASGNPIEMNPGSGSNASDLQNQFNTQDQQDAYGSTPAISGDNTAPVE